MQQKRDKKDQKPDLNQDLAVIVEVEPDVKLNVKLDVKLDVKLNEKLDIQMWSLHIWSLSITCSCALACRSVARSRGRSVSPTAGEQDEKNKIKKTRQ